VQGLLKVQYNNSIRLQKCKNRRNQIDWAQGRRRHTRARGVYHHQKDTTSEHFRCWQQLQLGTFSSPSHWPYTTSSRLSYAQSLQRDKVMIIKKIIL
jgi:hypothetical protein